MDIYYFTSQYEKPESPDDWNTWNLIIPFGKKKPKTGEDVLVLNYETKREAIVTKIIDRNDVRKWPFSLPPEMMRYAFKNIFKEIVRLI
jgi:hypothetical protein